LKSITIPVQLDSLLLPFVEATDEAAARECLEELLALVTPSIKKIVSASDSPEDDYQESSQQIIKALWQCRADPQQRAIGDFQRYVTVVAAHVTKRRWRVERPAYRALKESLRHTLRNDARFALWEEPSREWLCGLAAQRNQPVSSSERLARLSQHPLAYDEAILPGCDAQSIPQADLLDAIFTWLGGLVGFDQLVKIVFALRRIEDQTLIVEDHDEDSRSWSDLLVDTQPPPDVEARWRQFLEKLWSEIEQLPPLQRIAYLLNFTAGDGALESFWLYGVVSVRRIGAILGLSDEQFARVWADPVMDEKARRQAARLTGYDEKFALLWHYLPLSDQTIARLIGTERQKVINLRKSAGDRVARRLVAFKCVL